jgi:hypothetical protein
MHACIYTFKVQGPVIQQPDMKQVTKRQTHKTEYNDISTDPQGQNCTVNKIIVNNTNPLKTKHICFTYKDPVHTAQ